MVSLQDAFTPQVWPSFIAVLVMIGLAAYSIKNRGVPGAIPFAFACLFGILWSLALMFEFWAVDLEVMIFWRKFEVMWQLPSATAITCFLLEYARPKRWLTRRNLVLLSILPLLGILFILTNDFHHLFWTSFDFDGALVANLGPIAQVFLAYVYLLSFLNIVILIWLFIRSQENHWPVVIIMIGQIILRILYFSDVTGHARFNFPQTAVGLAIMTLVYAVVLFRFRLLGPMTLARQAVIEQIPIGMLVLDHQSKINSLNPVAECMLGVSSKKAKNKLVWDVLDAYPHDLMNADQDHQLDFKFTADGRVFEYQLGIIQLKDWRKDHVGQLLLLRDVTEQRKAQAKLLEQGRVVATLQERELLASELHDDLAQVLAFIDTQGQTVRRLLKRGDLETADSYLARLVEAARGGEVDLRDTIHAMRQTITDHGLIGTLEKHLEQFETSYGVRTELSRSEAFDQLVLDEMVEVQVLRILQEALTNIRKHAGADRVSLKFDVNDHLLCVTVEDNGRGFDVPDGEIGREKHFGLQMMRERAAAIGGTIRLTSRHGSGTEIMVCVPYEGSVVMR
jgi:PAS domain S-box-containing protein